MRTIRPHTTRTHTTRRHAIRAAVVVAGMVASSLAMVSSPASAHEESDEREEQDERSERDDDSDRVVVREGESIQAAIDAAVPGTEIVVRGDHVENLWIQTDDIELIGKNATLTMTDAPTPTPCTNFGQPPTLICVSPPVEPPDPNSEEPPPPPSLDEYLEDIEISGFTLHNPLFDAIGVLFTNDIEIEKNTIEDPGCDGIFLIFTTDFDISRNVVTGSQECSGIHVEASSSGEISRNRSNDNFLNGIDLTNTSDVEVERNSASGNCFGIVASDQLDGGYGIRAEDFPGRNVEITRNTTNANNQTCEFGPFLIGVAGIAAVGLTDVTISRNKSNDNVSEEESVTAGGIWVGDFPNFEAPPTLSNGVTVTRNTARGNSSAGVPSDLTINPVLLGELTVERNRCDVSTPVGFCS